MLGSASPDLLAIDDVLIALPRAKVFIDVVSVPLDGSVTPKAWRRSSPAAILGKYMAVWDSLP